MHEANTMAGRRDATAVNIDKRVGKTIKELRMFLGWSQSVLANRIGVTFQQLQKYEDGTNRVSASRLYQLTRALDIDIEDLFRGVGDIAVRKRPAGLQAADAGLPMKRETLQLFRYAAAIPSESRRMLIAFAKASQVMIDGRNRRAQRGTRARATA
jgi:transcriptional regulator with XRE-family HTH domain